MDDANKLAPTAPPSPWRFVERLAVILGAAASIATLYSITRARSGGRSGGGGGRR